MEQSVSLSGVVQPRRSVRWRQHLAGILLILPLCYSILRGFGICEPFLMGFDFQATLAFDQMVNAIIHAVQIVAFVFLLRIASNRMTRNAVWCGIGCLLTLFAVSVVTAFLFRSAQTNEKIGILSMVLQGCSVAESLMWVYIYAVILRNNNLDSSSRSWIGLLAAAQAVE